MLNTVIYFQKSFILHFQQDQVMKSVAALKIPPSLAFALTAMKKKPKKLCEGDFIRTVV